MLALFMIKFSIDYVKFKHSLLDVLSLILIWKSGLVYSCNNL